MSRRVLVTLAVLVVVGSGLAAAAPTSSQASIAASGTVIDSFEDGDLKGWSTSGTNTVNSEHAIDGTQSAEIDGYIENDSFTQPSSVSVWMRPILRDDLDKVELNVYLTDGGFMSTTFEFSDELAVNGKTRADGIQNDSWYHIQFRDIDYAANESQVVVTDRNGDILFVDTVSFVFYGGGKGTGVDRVRLSRQLHADYLTKNRYPNKFTYNVTGQVTDRNGQPVANATIEADNGDSTTTDANGNYQLSLPPGDYQLTMHESGYANQTISVSLDGDVTRDIVTTAHDPPQVLLNEPVDGASAATPQVTLNATVRSSAFATSNDSVEVTFFSDGTPAYTTNITSNQTVTTTVAHTRDGQHDWSVLATVPSGDSVASTSAGPRNYTTPGSLVVRNISSGAVINETATIQLFGDDAITTLSGSNGTIPLTTAVDLPAIGAVDAPGYESTEIVLEDRQNETVYLYPENNTELTANLTARLDDRTGNWPSAETSLRIYRERGSGWVLVAAPEFGLDANLTAELRQGYRYRLELVNTETGARRSGGTVQVSNDRTVVLTIFGDRVEPEVRAPTVVAEPDPRVLPAKETSLLEVRIGPRETPLNRWTITATANGTRLDRYRSSDSDGGVYDPTLNLSDRAGETLTVRVNWTLADGTTGTATFEFRIAETFDNQASLFGGVAQIMGQVDHPDMLGTFFAMLGTLLLTGVVAQQYRLGTEPLAGVAVAILAGFALAGLAPMSIVFVAGTGGVALALLRRGL